MAWTSMHYAVGMGCGTALVGTACLIFRRGWRFLPVAMTVGGIWALLPDMPRFFREDFPSLPLAGILGGKSFERCLHRYGDLFCFHSQLDSQPREYALAGLGIIVILYNLCLGLLMFLEFRQRNSIGNRAWKAHRNTLGYDHRSDTRRRGHSHLRHSHSSQGPPLVPIAPPPKPSDPLPLSHDDDPVIHRIVPDDPGQTG